METIRESYRSIHKVHKVAATACCVAARGDHYRLATCVPPTRYGFEPGSRDDYIGFRLALGPGEQGVSPAEPVTGKGLAAKKPGI
jgi:hypothetical protein